MDQLAFVEWCRSSYEAFGIIHQGLVSDEIVVPEHPAALSDTDRNFETLFGVYDFADWAETEALFLPGEFSPIAYVSRCVEGYIASVNNGGHAQFLSRYKWSPIFVRACELGLWEIGSEHHERVFSRFKAFVDADLERANAIANRYDAGEEVGDDIHRFDEMLYASDLIAQLTQQADWLLKVAKTRAVRRDELTQHRALFAKLNLQSTHRANGGADEQRVPSSAVLQVSQDLAGAAGVPIGPFFQTYMTALTDYEFGAWPVPTRVWRFAQRGSIHDVVIVPSRRFQPARAILWSSATRVSVDLDEGQFLRLY